jgi:hydroxyacylglutathione hydrolase
MIEIRQIPCLQDNYGYLVREPQSGETATIDTPDAAAILEAAAQAGWRITQIWNTHWHPDHAGGNAEIVSATGARVLGPPEISRIAAAPDEVAVEGGVARLGRTQARILEVGGHTLGHVAYVFDEEKAAFVGDTMFALGCGRLFEGSAEQMWTSLSRLAALPPETMIHCAHEYTQSNARFALSVDKENAALRARALEIDRARAEGRPTVPMPLALELETNPFLRAPELKSGLGLRGRPDWEAFKRLRAMKDAF